MTNTPEIVEEFCSTPSSEPSVKKTWITTLSMFSTTTTRTKKKLLRNRIELTMDEIQEK